MSLLKDDGPRSCKVKGRNLCRHRTSSSSPRAIMHEGGNQTFFSFHIESNTVMKNKWCSYEFIARVKFKFSSLSSTYAYIIHLVAAFSRMTIMISFKEQREQQRWFNSFPCNHPFTAYNFKPLISLIRRSWLKQFFTRQSRRYVSRGKNESTWLQWENIFSRVFLESQNCLCRILK